VGVVAKFKAQQDIKIIIQGKRYDLKEGDIIEVTGLDSLGKPLARRMRNPKYKRLFEEIG